MGVAGDRAKLFPRIRRLVVKLGTKVLTSGGDSLDEGRIRDIAAQVSELRCRGLEIALVTSGAIATGMGKLGYLSRPRSIPELQAAAAVGQNLLMHLYEDAFREHRQLVGQVLLTAEDFKYRNRYLNIRNTFYSLFKHGVVPIVNENDSVAVEEIKFGDNDLLSAQVASLVGAELLVILSDIDGLYADYPPGKGENHPITLVEKITPELEALAGGCGSELSTGGMVTKLEAAKLVTRAGQMMVIANGLKHSLVDIVEGKKIGTLFLSAGDPISSRKRWIAFSLERKGSITLDQGAMEAILKKGKSILPSGVVGVKGQFELGEMIGVEDERGVERARGITNYSAEEICRVMGHKSGEIEEILGYKYYDEVIHRDNLVVL